MSNVFGIGTRGPVPADESDVESTDGEREVDPQGEETETAPEGEDNDEDSVTRCIWWVENIYIRSNKVYFMKIILR